MTTEIKKKSEYAQLCEDLQSLIEKGRKQAISAINEVFVETNWQMGKCLGKVEETYPFHILLAPSLELKARK